MRARTADPSNPRAGATFARWNGTYDYPTADAYVQNVADLVELRVKALDDATAFRLTFNSMTDPKLVGTTIALGSSPAPQAFPHGANVVAPGPVLPHRPRPHRRPPRCRLERSRSRLRHR